MVFITYCLWRYDWEEGEVWMVSVLILFALLAYVGLAVGPAQRLYKEEMEE
jgi:hypothetical protein